MGDAKFKNIIIKLIFSVDITEVHTTALRRIDLRSDAAPLLFSNHSHLELIFIKTC